MCADEWGLLWLGLHWAKALEWVCPRWCPRRRRRQVQSVCEVCVATSTLLSDGLVALNVGRVWGAWYLLMTMDHGQWGRSDRPMDKWSPPLVMDGAQSVWCSPRPTARVGTYVECSTNKRLV